MKTVIINGREYTGVQPQGMSDLAFKSMLVRNAMTLSTEQLKAIAERFNHGN